MSAEGRNGSWKTDLIVLGSFIVLLVLVLVVEGVL
jgi:hypothetical protein